MLLLEVFQVYYLNMIYAHEWEFFFLMTHELGGQAGILPAKILYS